MGVVAFSGVAIVTPITTLAYKGYSDVKSSAYYYDAVKTLTELGVINGYGDGTYRPNSYVTRGEAAKVFSDILNLDTVNVSNPGFIDVPTTHPLYGSIAALANLGFVNVDNISTFHPNQPIQRNEMALLMATLFNLQATNPELLPFTDVTTEYREAITALYENHVTAGTSPTTFDGSSYVTRGQFAAFIVRATKVPPKQETAEVSITIDSVSEGAVLTSEGKYTVSNSVAALFTQENAKLLEGAEINAIVEKGKIVAISSLTLNSSGTEGAPLSFNGANIVIDGDITVNADHVRLENFTLNGDLLITEKVTTEVTVEEVKVNGQMKLESASNSVASLNHLVANTTKGPKINLIKSLLEGIHIARNYVEINSDTKIPLITFGIGVSSIQINADVTKIVIDVNIQVEITGNALIDQLILQKATELALKIIGEVKELFVHDSSTKIELGTQINIDTVILPENSRPLSVLTNFYTIKNKIKKIIDSNEKIIEVPSPSSSGSSNVSTPTVDKSVLTNTIATVKSLIAENYTEVSWNDLQSTLAAAQLVLNNANATQADVTTAVNNLKSAIKSLVVTNNLGELFFNNFSLNMTQEQILTTAEQLGLTRIDIPILLEASTEATTLVEEEDEPVEHEYEEPNLDDLDTIFYFTNDPNAPSNPNDFDEPMNMIAFGLSDGKVIIQGFIVALPSEDSSVARHYINNYKNLISQKTDLQIVDEEDIGYPRVSLESNENADLRVASIDSEYTMDEEDEEDEEQNEEGIYEYNYYQGNSSIAYMMASYNPVEKLTNVMFTEISINTAVVAVDTYEELKAAMEDPNVRTINIYDDIEITEPLVVESEKHINGNGYILTASSPGYYALQFIDTVGSVEDIWITGADAAILVDNSTVNLHDDIEVSGNKYGGIVVSSGTLDVSDAYLWNEDEANDKPTIWEESIGNIESDSQVIGHEYAGISKVDYKQLSEENIQRFYYLNDELSAPNQLDVEFNVTNLEKLPATIHGQVDLSFSPVTGAQEVWIEISQDGEIWGPASTLVALDNTSNSASIANLLENQTYYFRLAASKNGMTKYSDSLEVRIESMAHPLQVQEQDGTEVIDPEGEKEQDTEGNEQPINENEEQQPETEENSELEQPANEEQPSEEGDHQHDNQDEQQNAPENKEATEDSPTPNTPPMEPLDVLSYNFGTTALQTRYDIPLILTLHDIHTINKGTSILELDDITSKKIIRL